MKARTLFSKGVVLVRGPSDDLIVPGGGKIVVVTVDEMFAALVGLPEPASSRGDVVTGDGGVKTIVTTADEMLAVHGPTAGTVP